ncbi:MAG: glycosyltransferase [Pseudomonadota bacterium]
MKVMIVANARAVHTQRWAQALNERGHTVTVASIRNANIPGVEVLSRSIGNADGHKLWALFSYVRLLLTLPFDLFRTRPDVVNPHYCITHGAIAALIDARPRVVNIWGSDIIWDGAGAMPWWRKALVRFSLSHADAIVSTSQFMADAVTELIKDPPPVTLVPFGVDTAVFCPGEIAKTDTRVRIGFVKTFAKKYAPDIFIEAASIAAQQQSCIDFVMAGRGRLLEEMKALAAERGLGDRMSFPGFVAHEEVAAFMHDLDILVNCSRYDSESFGVVICEASASGLPVIATDVGGVCEAMEDGKTGILVPRNDAEALASTMIKLARDADLRRRMGAAGRAFICENYEWAHCIDKMEGALGAVTDRTSQEKRQGATIAD